MTLKVGKAYGSEGNFRDSLNVVITRCVMSRHKRKTIRENKLQREILNLEKQLKQHPLGAIILNAKIKEKRIEIKNLNLTKLSRGMDRRKRFIIRREDKNAL